MLFDSGCIQEKYFMENVSIGERLSALGELLLHCLHFLSPHVLRRPKHALAHTSLSRQARRLLITFHTDDLPGPEAYVPAALSFYRALRIYPAPAELLQSGCCSLSSISLSPS